MFFSLSPEVDHCLGLAFKEVASAAHLQAEINIAADHMDKEKALWWNVLWIGNQRCA